VIMTRWAIGCWMEMSSKYHMFVLDVWLSKGVVRQRPAAGLTVSVGLILS